MPDQISPPGSKPKPPPGASEVTHRPIRTPIHEAVRMLRDQYIAHRQPATVEDLAVIVCPLTAAEIYTWGWVVHHPEVLPYTYNPRLISFVDYVTSDIVGTVLGYVTMMSPLQIEGQIQVLPFGAIEKWKRDAADWHAQQARGGCR